MVWACVAPQSSARLLLAWRRYLCDTEAAGAVEAESAGRSRVVPLQRISLVLALAARGTPLRCQEMRAVERKLRQARPLLKRVVDVSS